MMQAARDGQVGKRQKSNPTDSKAQHRLNIHTEENQAEVFPSADSQPPETNMTGCFSCNHKKQKRPPEKTILLHLLFGEI